MKKILSVLLVVILMASLLIGCSGNTAQTTKPVSTDPVQTDTPADSEPPADEPKDLTFANLPKSVGGAWFNRMAVGIERFGKDTGYEAFQTGADKGDAALQVKEVENLIAQKVDVLTVVPVSPETLEPVLQKARDEGIVVISHEAQGIANVDFDVEAFDGATYGAHLMDQMAKAMGEEGDYIISVGSLTAVSHMAWANGALEHQKATYPNMNCLNADAFEESNYNQKASQEKSAELMRTYPDLKGMFVTSATDLPGYALAIEEAGKNGDVVLVGNGLPSANRDYIKSGALTFLGCWDPADAGYVMCRVGELVAKGEEIKAGMDLGVAGYENIELIDNVIVGKAWKDVTTETIDDIDF